VSRHCRKIQGAKNVKGISLEIKGYSMASDRLRAAVSDEPPKDNAHDLIRNFSSFLEARKDKLVTLLPRHLDAHRMVRLTVTEFANNWKLRRCSAMSIYSALLQAAAVGLEIGVAGQSFLLPYKNKRGEYECKWIPGYRGLILLARRTKEIGDVRTEIVYENDFLEFEMGLYPILRHKPNLKEARGSILMVYGIANYLNGDKHLEFMTLGDVEEIRARTKATSEMAPWNTDFNEMARKTVIRRMSKYLPMSIEMHNALELDRYAAEGRRAEINDDGIVITLDEDPPNTQGPESDPPEPEGAPNA
jgi:recombination protein RecT